MQDSFDLNNIRIEVERRPIKTMRLTVYPPDGKVKIAAPLSVGARMIRDFAVSKLAWIEKHRARFMTRPEEKNLFIDGEIHYIWGQPFPLELIQRKGHPKIEIQDRRLLMYVPPGTERTKKQRLFEKWRHGLVQTAALRIVAKWEPVLRIKINGLFYRKMKTHWGSCNYGRKTIRLNTELGGKSPEYLEYVILHEMIHIIEPSHNRNFYRLLGQYYPEWKTLRKKMNQDRMHTP
jgi:predicted metal-dependent hydrolase